MEIFPSWTKNAAFRRKNNRLCVLSWSKLIPTSFPGSSLYLEVERGPWERGWTDTNSYLHYHSSSHPLLTLQEEHSPQSAPAKSDVCIVWSAISSRKHMKYFPFLRSADTLAHLSNATCNYCHVSATAQRGFPAGTYPCSFPRCRACAHASATTIIEDRGLTRNPPGFSEHFNKLGYGPVNMEVRFLNWNNAANNAKRRDQMRLIFILAPLGYIY